MSQLPRAFRERLDQEFSIPRLGLSARQLSGWLWLENGSLVVVSLVAGTMFLMWLGEQITERGIGNGISILIFGGIAAGLPGAIGGLFELVRNGAMSAPVFLFIAVLVVAVTYAVVFVERGHVLGQALCEAVAGEIEFQLGDYEEARLTIQNGERNFAALDQPVLGLLGLGAPGRSVIPRLGGPRGGAGSRTPRAGRSPPASRTS